VPFILALIQILLICSQTCKAYTNGFISRSVNEVICHGIPDMRKLENGDICNGMSDFGIKKGKCQKNICEINFKKTNYSKFVFVKHEHFLQFTIKSAKFFMNNSTDSYYLVGLNNIY
jgi:hypothetical protein